MEKRQSSFWASLPGILTALGTLVAAAGGLIALFVGTSAVRHSPALVTSTVTATASPSGGQAGGTTGGSGTAGGSGTTGGSGGTTSGTGVTNGGNGGTGGGTRHHRGGGGRATSSPCPSSGSGGTGCTTGGGPAQLAAPVQASPADGTLLTNYPRDTVLTWQASPGAASYLVEIQCLDCDAVGQWSPWQSATITGTNYPFTWVGDNYGRWRVTAVGADGSQGTPSGWWQFDFRTQPVG